MAFELNKEELRMVERLRKQQRRWRWARWTTLLVGVFSAGGCVSMLYFVLAGIRPGNDPASAAFVLAIAFPGLLIFACSAAFCLYLALRNWGGNTIQTLLLRIVDDSTKPTAT